MAGFASIESAAALASTSSIEMPAVELQVSVSDQLVNISCIEMLAPASLTLLTLTVNDAEVINTLYGI